jgi:DNA-binding HxlR family transcriptional regulator
MKAKPAARRTYQQHCGLARALDVVGERWTLLVVRELLLGPRRYGDLLATLDGITTNLLAKRLKEMAAAGLVEKRRAEPPASGEVYGLTEAGLALEPAIMELGRWGARLLQRPRRGDRRNLGWALLSLKRRYTGGVRGTVQITAGDRLFELRFTEERMTVTERPAAAAEARVVAGSEEPFFALFFAGISWAALEQRGQLGAEGDRELWSRVLAALGVPALPVDVAVDVS